MFTRCKLLIAATVAVLLGACGSGGGGGGGSSSSPAAVPTFQLFPSGHFSNGYTETYQLSGSDTAGGTYTATLSETTQAQTIFNGQPAIPVQLIIEVKDAKTGTSIVSRTSTGYFSTDNGSRMYLGYVDSTGAAFTGAPISVIPQSATIGFSGALGSYTSSLTGVTIIWQLTNANNGLANLVISWTTTKQWSGEGIYTIDQSGSRKSLTLIVIIHLTTGSDLSITLSGNKQ